MMALLAESLVVDVVLGAVTLVGLLYLYITSIYNYWQKRGVPYPKPSFPYGNLKDLIYQKKQFLTLNQDLYNSFPKEKFFGYFEGMKPALMVRDPELIQRILIKDFSYFVNRGMTVDIENEPLSVNLVNMEDQMWKNLRNKLTPTFTTGKLKGMIDQMCTCGGELFNEIEKNISNNETVDSKKLCSSFTIDVISSCAFGLQFRPDSPEGVQFRKMVGAVFDPARTKFIMFLFFFKKLARFFGVTQFTKEVNNYFTDLVRQTIQYRKKNNIHRNDFLQLMMNLKEQENSGKEISWKTELSEEDKYLNQIDYSKLDEKIKGLKLMTDECIAAQSFVFLLAGSEIVANAMSLTLFELAANPEVQQRLQQEVDSALKAHGGKLTHEALKDMTYLDLIIQERNRKYSEAGAVFRVCAAPYKIPGTDVVIEKGTKVVIPFHAIHNDPEYYPEPDKIVPERFDGNNYRSSGTYLPFGDGPRICIGMRFALLELKACISLIMSRYSVTVDPKTQVPLQLDPKTANFNVLGGVWVKFQKRDSNNINARICG